MEQNTGLNWPRDDFTDIKTPFEKDLLNRKPLAEHLTRYIDRLQVGAVLALDARWGEGKTWFVMHWQKYLEQTERPHKVIYINAFAQDNIDDPFLLIAAELRAIIAQDLPAQKRFTEKVMQVGKVLAPAAYKAAVSTGVKWAMGINDGGDKLEKLQEQLIDAASEQVGLWVENQIKEHENNKNAFTNFKTVLKELAAKHEQPIVIIIDELDRCNPLFSVRMIERIKHFFDIPNIVFVLVCDKHQLQKTICHQFGYDNEYSEAYLEKFIDFSIQLEKSKTSSDEYLTIITNTMKNLGFTELEINEIKGDILVFASVFNTSIRQLKKKLNQFTLLKTEISDQNRFLLFKLFNKNLDSSIPLFYYLLDAYFKYIGLSFETHEPKDIAYNIKNRLFKIAGQNVISSDEQHDITTKLQHSLFASEASFLFINNIIYRISIKFEQSLVEPEYNGFNQVVLDYCSQRSPSKLNTILEMNDAWDEYIKTGLNE